MSDEYTENAAEGAQAATTPPDVPTPPAPPKPSDVASLMEKMFMMGAGAASLTKEKIDAFSSELIERGRMSDSEAHKVADWMSQQASKQAAAVESTFSAESSRAASEAGVATKKDIETLQEQILELKAMIASQRGQ